MRLVIILCAMGIVFMLRPETAAWDYHPPTGATIVFNLATVFAVVLDMIDAENAWRLLKANQRGGVKEDGK